jgi:Carboxypeptidase regulatory-like domain
MCVRFESGLIGLAVVALGWSSYCLGQTSQSPSVPGPESPAIALAGEQPAAALSGSVSGTVVDQSGALVAGAEVTLTRENHSPTDHSSDDPSPSQEVLTGGDGQFCFTNVTPGPFHLTISSAGLATQTYTGILHSGEADTVPDVALAVATNITEVQVKLTRSEVAEVAEEQLKVEEKQRVLGAIPNFYVSYVPNAAPLTSRQKFKLAARSVVDPFTFVVVAGSAGVEQWQNHFIGYGQGAEGYAKRFGAGYADTVSGTFIGGAILPSLLKQDPRYFYKGTGSTRSRFLYAIAMSVICKGDNGRWQLNYSNILGSLAAGGISNLYYPAQDRDGAELTFENAAIGLGSNAVSNLLQEFVIRKLTPKLPRQNAATAQP